MKYSVDVHEMVFPKYAKLQLKINKAGNMTLTATPSFTPGKMPEGVKKGGFVEKGARIFNYDNQIIVSLTFTDCLNIIDFVHSKNVAKTVDIFRTSSRYNKKVNLTYFADEDNPGTPKFAIFWFNSLENDVEKEIKFKLPLSFANLEEIAKVLESYVQNYAMIKLFCQAQLQEDLKNKKI